MERRPMRQEGATIQQRPKATPAGGEQRGTRPGARSVSPPWGLGSQRSLGASAATSRRGSGSGSRSRQRDGPEERRRVPRPGAAATGPEAAGAGRERAKGLGQAGGAARRREQRAAAAGVTAPCGCRSPAAGAPERAGETPAASREAGGGKLLRGWTPPARRLGPAARLGAGGRERGLGAGPRRGGRGCRLPRSPVRPRLPGEGAPPPAARQEPGRGVPLTRTPAREDGPGASAAGKEAAAAAAKASGAGPPRLRVCGGGLLPAPAPGRPRRSGPARPSRRGALPPAAAICRRRRRRLRGPADSRRAAALRCGVRPRLPEGKAPALAAGPGANAEGGRLPRGEVPLAGRLATA